MTQVNQEREFESEKALLGDEQPDGSQGSASSQGGNPTAGNVEPAAEGMKSDSAIKGGRTGETEELAQMKAELNKYKDVALRSVADLDNYRKRMAREKDDAIRYANAGFLERLIPILDNFELGLQAAKAAGNQSAVLAGMSMVSKQLQDFLSSCGVETIDATGQHFDPNSHEAIAQEWNEEVPEGFVIRQLRKGYKLKDRLIRPANVVVSKGAPVSENSATPDAGT
ncbi:MAG TPA: nucleotide exchange factor GrpE [Chthoniobacterales bacterium]|jgi:molecular chaperone GrpE|nr:nucleotide exchange factor GrpE [Chthoniobacterales bacterium]